MIYRTLKYFLFFSSILFITLLLLEYYIILKYPLLFIIYFSIAAIFAIIPPPSRTKIEKMQHRMGKGYAYFKNKKGEIAQKKLRL